MSAPAIPFGHLNDLIPVCIRLPSATDDQLVGAVKIISHASGRMSQKKLGSSLRYDDEQIVALVEVLSCLGLVDTIGSDVGLTEFGERVASSAMAERRQLFAESLMRLPIIREIMEALREQATRSFERSKLLDIIGAQSCPADADRAFDYLVAWGRYARLFACDSNTGQVSIL